LAVGVGFLFSCAFLFSSSAWADGLSSALETHAKAWHLSAQDRENMRDGQLVLHKKETTTQVMQANAFLVVNAPVAHIFTLITDFKQLPDYAPHVAHISMLHANSEQATVAYTLALPMGIEKRYRLQLDYVEQGQSKQMLWQKTAWQPEDESQRIGQTTGYWLIQATADANVSIIAYQTITDPGDVPFGLGWIVAYLSDTSIKALLMQTKIRAETQWLSQQKRTLH